MSETNLKIGEIIFPVGSARGITQSFDLVDNGSLRRTVNGTLVDTTRQVNRKYTTSISCNDMGMPTLTGLWRGMQVDVDCISKFREFYNPPSEIVNITRTPVDGSIVGYNSLGEKVEFISQDELELTFDSEVSFVDYSPRLTMLVSSVSHDEDEYGAETSWSIDLEEV